MDGHPVRAVFGLNRLLIHVRHLTRSQNSLRKVACRWSSPQYQRTIKNRFSRCRSRPSLNYARPDRADILTFGRYRIIKQRCG